MNFQSRMLLLKSVLGGLFMVSAVSADAGCHGRSGGGSYGSSHSSYHGYNSHAYSSPVYHQPVYSTPSYPQHVYQQPQPVYVQPQPVPFQTQQPPQTGYGQQGIPTQPGFVSQPTNPAIGQPMQVASMQPGLQSPPTQPNMPMQTGTSQSGSIPANAAPAFPTQAPNNGASVNSPQVDAQQSALQALGAFAPPQAPIQSAASASGQQSVIVGSWVSNLPNGARVELVLQADGNFSWTAINKEGQSSVFQGTYAVEAGSLALTRSNDSQTLQGSMTPTGTNAFSFKLSADQASSLDFVRS